MSERVRVRRAVAGDLAAVGELTLAAYVDGGFLEPTHGYAAHLQDAAGRSDQAELWVAQIDHDVVGSVTFCPPGSALREVAADDEGEFRMLAVSVAQQRRGVARALVEHCFDRCRALNLGRMAICSLPQMTAAHGLYREFGFERDERLDWSPVEGVELWGFRAPVPG